MAKKKKRKAGIPGWMLVLICIALVIAAGIYSGKELILAKYTDPSHAEWSKEQYQKLDRHSLEYQAVQHILNAEELAVLSAEAADVPIPENTVTVESSSDPDTNHDGIVIEHIYGGIYEGYMMKIKDPSQVFIGLNWQDGNGEAPELPDYINHYGAIAGVNGGGFMDAGGVGNGGTPSGIVIQDGNLISGNSEDAVIGFTADHKLITAYMTPQEALDAGIQNAVSFGPIFITNGEITYRPGTDNLNMLNPRTAIGQTEDGTILLLVVDGRGPSSFGAQYEDIIQIFQNYGAVMAANLDGGNSSVMMYQGRYIHYPVSMYDSRSLPDAILVKEAQ